MSKEGGGTEETAADQVHWASEFALAARGATNGRGIGRRRRAGGAG